MRHAELGVIVCVGLVIALWGIHSQRNTASAQDPQANSPAAFAQAQDVIALSFDLGNGRQQVTVIDSRKRVMSVYHIESGSGEISLKSVRSIQWDLQMDEFNGVSPLPREIRSLMLQR